MPELKFFIFLDVKKKSLFSVSYNFKYLKLILWCIEIYGARHKKTGYNPALERVYAEF